MKLRDVLREEPARFTIDDTPGKEYSMYGNKDRRVAGSAANFTGVDRRESSRGSENQWRSDLSRDAQKDPNSKNWDIVSNSGKVLKTGLTKADAEKIISGRQDLVSKYGQLKVVFHSRVGF